MLSQLFSKRSKSAGKLNSGLEVWLTGVAEADELLGKLQDDLVIKLTRAAMRKIAKPIAAAVRSKAPVKTGALRNSVKVRGVKSVRRGKFRTKGKWRNRVGASIRVGQGFFIGDTFYGGFLEFGTGDRYKKPTGNWHQNRVNGKRVGQSTGKIDAGKFEFVRNTSEQHRGLVVTEFTNALRAAAADAQKRANRKGKTIYKPGRG